MQAKAARLLNLLKPPLEVPARLQAQCLAQPFLDAFALVQQFLLSNAPAHRSLTPPLGCLCPLHALTSAARRLLQLRLIGHGQRVGQVGATPNGAAHVVLGAQTRPVVALVLKAVRQ